MVKTQIQFSFSLFVANINYSENHITSKNWYYLWKNWPIWF